MIIKFLLSQFMAPKMRTVMTAEAEAAVAVITSSHIHLIT